MKKIIISLFVLFNLTAFSQNSLLLNPNFEFTTWPEVAWMSQTNTGAAIISSEYEPEFTAMNVTARSGWHFAYIGGSQTANGKYECTLAQEFEIPKNGTGHLTFYYRYIRESVDPGSYIKILIDGNEVWSIAPHFIVDAEDTYVQVQINLGHVEAGHHTFELLGYEFPVGGDLPMQFAFDDISFQSTSTASIENNNQNQLNVVVNNGMIQLNTVQDLNQDVVIEMMDLSGKQVLSNPIYFTNNYSIPTPTMVPGIYLISLRTSQQVLTQKIYLH